MSGETYERKKFPVGIFYLIRLITCSAGKCEGKHLQISPVQRLWYVQWNVIYKIYVWIQAFQLDIWLLMISESLHSKVNMADIIKSSEIFIVWCILWWLRIILSELSLWEKNRGGAENLGYYLYYELNHLSPTSIIPVLQNMSVSGNRAFKDVIKLLWGH